ncbi:MAG: hypothetical protein HGA19_18125 [Oscillochloris sp.]|nr:hypothetical protein [Oscillochloris sp.]
MPNQRPEEILKLLQAHLVERGFADIVVEQLPGGYPPAHVSYDLPFILQVIKAGTAVYHTPLNTSPSGPLTVPLQVFAQSLRVPVASVGLSRPDSAIHGPNERVPVDDLTRHAVLLGEVLTLFSRG